MTRGAARAELTRREPIGSVLLTHGHRPKTVDHPAGTDMNVDGRGLLATLDDVMRASGGDFLGSTTLPTTRGLATATPFRLALDRSVPSLAGLGLDGCLGLRISGPRLFLPDKGHSSHR